MLWYHHVLLAVLQEAHHVRVGGMPIAGGFKVEVGVEVGTKAVIVDGSEAGMVGERLLGNCSIVMPVGGAVIASGPCWDDEGTIGHGRILD